MMSDMRERREQSRPVEIPKAYQSTAKEVRLSLLADTVDLMAAIINDAVWHVHVDPAKEGSSTAFRNSSLRERWSEAMVEQCMADLGRPVLDNIAVNQVGDGMGCLKVIHRPDHWTDLPSVRGLFGKRADELDEGESKQYVDAVDSAKRGAKLPFSLIDVDPLTVFPIYSPNGELECVLEICDRPLRTTLLQYNDRIGLKSRKGENGVITEVVPLAELGDAKPLSQFLRSQDPRATVEVMEYWDKEDHITFVDSVPVKYVRHSYGQPPYFMCFAKPNPSREPHVYARPPGYKSKWLLDLIDSLWTMMGNVGTLFSYPTPITTTPLKTNIDKGKDGKPRAAKWKVGEHVVLYEGQEFHFATPPVEHLQMMQALVQQAHTMYDAATGLGSAIKGQGGSGEAGYALNQLMQASMLTLNPAVASRDTMLANAIRFIWRIIEKRIKDTVFVWGTEPDPEPGVKGKENKWLGMGPKDISGYYRCKVESKPLVDQMRIARGQFALGMVKGRLLDRRRAIEDFLGYEDPDAIMDDIWVDEILETPGPIKDMTINNALKRAGYIQPEPPQPPQPEGPVPPGMVPLPGGPPGMPPGPPGMPPGPNGAGALMQGQPPMQGINGNLPQQPVGPGVGMGSPDPSGAPPFGASMPGGALPGVAQPPHLMQPHPIQAPQ